MSFLNQLFPTQTRQQIAPWQAQTTATPDALQQMLNLAYLGQLNSALQVPFGGGSPMGQTWGMPGQAVGPAPAGAAPPAVGDRPDEGSQRGRMADAFGNLIPLPQPGGGQQTFGGTFGPAPVGPALPGGPVAPDMPGGEVGIGRLPGFAAEKAAANASVGVPLSQQPMWNWGPAQTGLAGLLQPQPGIFGLTPGQQGLLGGTQMALAGQLGGLGDYAQQLLGAMGGLGGLTQPNPAFSLSPQGQEAQGQAMQSLQAGLGAQAQQDYFSRIIAPTIVNNMTAQGQGRSGGIGEALGLAGTNFAAQALPYRAQMANQLMSLAQLPQTLAQQDVARQQQLIEQIMGNAPRGAPFASGLASGLMNLSRLPQQLSQQDLKRRQDLLSGIFAGLPFRPGQTQQQLQGGRTTQTTQTSPQGGQAGLQGLAGLPALGSLGLTALGGGQIGNVNFPGLGTQLGGLLGGLSNLFGPNPGSQSVGGSTGLLPPPSETPVLPQNLSGIQ